MVIEWVQPIRSAITVAGALVRTRSARCPRTVIDGYRLPSCTSVDMSVDGQRLTIGLQHSPA
jgi:hypothetical protein